MKTYDTWEQTAQYQSEHGGIIWRHDAGHYAVTESHSDADELPDSEKWTELERDISIQEVPMTSNISGKANEFISRLRVELMSVERNEQGSGAMAMMLGLVGFVALIMFLLLAGAMPDFSTENIFFSEIVN